MQSEHCIRPKFKTQIEKQFVYLLAQDRDRRRAIVDAVMDLRVP